MGHPVDASGLVTSFLDNYRVAESPRRLHVTLYDHLDNVTDVMGVFGNLLLDVRKAVGVVGEVLPDLGDLRDLEEDIDKEDFALHRRLSIKFVMGNAECLVKVE